ncbi:twin-arginine translocase TatA/TatE family subunit [Intrasporangium sp. YIM S08009]|uniref:twin-arginine translocase TatA/TatE family subunit n=1 Tax=Intrasporangium zincisolvens TaxID=3080018 RepID=UPI002B05A4AF|nr:twin-arginine translocase TatA/TatE family subunit [Intrasporangium sp. YIM S08009]
MADLGWPEMLIIAIAAMVLFGWKRLPDASRSLGRSIRVFRSEIAGMRTDGETEPAPTTVTPGAVAPSGLDAPAPVTTTQVTGTPLRPE